MPGQQDYGFSATLSDILTQRREEARQAMMDQLTAKAQAENSALRQQEMADRAADREQKILDAKQKDALAMGMTYGADDALPDTLIQKFKDAKLEDMLSQRQVGVPNPQGETPETLDLQTQTTRRRNPDELVAQRIQEALKSQGQNGAPLDPKALGGMLIGADPKNAPTYLRDIITNQSGYNSQRDTAMYHGKAVDVFVDPRTKQVFLPQPGGKMLDITGEAEHYEKPSDVLVQSGNEYITRDEAARRARAGQPVPLANSAQTRAMMEGAKMLQPHIQQVENMAVELDKAGLFGPIMSRIREGMSKVGTIDEFTQWLDSDPVVQAASAKDRLVGDFATSLSLLASGAGRVHGGARGGGSPQMYGIFRQALSDAATLPMFMGRLDALDSFMEGYAAGPGGPKPALPVAPGQAPPTQAAPNAPVTPPVTPVKKPPIRLNIDGSLRQ